MAERTDFLPTRESLLEGLTDLGNQRVWQEFFESYWQLIYGVAIKEGFSHDEAREILQDTIISVSKSIRNFRRDPGYGSFKSWLMTITYRRMRDLRRRRGREDYEPPDEEQEGPPTDLEQSWDAEWKAAVRTAALEKFKRSTPPKHFQIFFLHVIEGISVAETARIVGTTTAQVYLLKHRLARVYRKCLEQAETQLDI